MSPLIFKGNGKSKASSNMILNKKNIGLNIVLSLIVTIGSSLLFNAYAFVQHFKPKGSDEYFLKGISSSLFLAVSFALFFLLSLWKQKVVSILVQVFIMTTILYFAFMLLDSSLFGYEILENLLNFSGYKINYYGGNWMRQKSIEIGSVTTVIPALLIVNLVIVVVYNTMKTNTIISIDEKANIE